MAREWIELDWNPAPDIERGLANFPRPTLTTEPVYLTAACPWCKSSYAFKAENRGIDCDYEWWFEATGLQCPDCEKRFTLRAEVKRGGVDVTVSKHEG